MEEKEEEKGLSDRGDAGEAAAGGAGAGDSGVEGEGNRVPAEVRSFLIAGMAGGFVSYL